MPGIGHKCHSGERRTEDPATAELRHKLEPLQRQLDAELAKKGISPEEQRAMLRQTLAAERDTQSFAERLQSLRRAKGLSVQELALCAGIEPHILVGIDEGYRMPTTAIMRKLADALDTTLEYLCGPRQLTLAYMCGPRQFKEHTPWVGPDVSEASGEEIKAFAAFVNARYGDVSTTVAHQAFLDIWDVAERFRAGIGINPAGTIEVKVQAFYGNRWGEQPVDPLENAVYQVVVAAWLRPATRDNPDEPSLQATFSISSDKEPDEIERRKKQFMDALRRCSVLFDGSKGEAS